MILARRKNLPDIATDTAISHPGLVLQRYLAYQYSDPICQDNFSPYLRWLAWAVGALSIAYRKRHVTLPVTADSTVGSAGKRKDVVPRLRFLPTKTPVHQAIQKNCDAL